MSRFSRFFPFVVFLFLFVGIFYKVFFKGLVPFPGDLLVSWFVPYKAGGWDGFTPYITHKEFIGADTIRQIFPWRILAADLFKSGIVPLWNPYNFSGTPLLANLQSAVFYPLNLLFFVFSDRVGWVIYILLQPVLATLFMWLFVYRLTKSIWAGLFSGIIFSFIGFVMVWFLLGVVGHTLLWLPLALYGILVFSEKNDQRYLILAAFSLGMTTLAGHAQTSVYIFLLSAAFYLFVTWKKYTVKEKIINIWFIPASIALGAIQLIPTFEFLQLAARDAATSIKTFTEMRIPFSHLVMLFAPDFFGNRATENFWGKDYAEFITYIGIPGIFFAVVGILTTYKKPITQFFSAVSVISLLFALQTPLSDIFALLHVPVLDTGIPARISVLAQFSLCVLSGIGITEFFTTRFSIKKILLPVGIIGSIFILLWGSVYLLPFFNRSADFVQHMAIAKRNLALPSLLYFITACLFVIGNRMKNYTLIAFFILLSLSAFDAQYFLYKYTSFTPESYMFPHHPLITQLQTISGQDRVFAYDTARIETNLATQYRLFMSEGYDPLYIRRYGELFYAAQTGIVSHAIPRSDAQFVNSLPRDDTYSKQVLLNLLGTKYMVDKDDLSDGTFKPDTYRFPANRFTLNTQNSIWKIYTNNDALSRASLFYSSKTVPNDNELVSTLFSQNFDYRKTLLLEKTLPIQLSNNDATGSATIQSYTANDVRIAVTTTQPALLFLSDAYYPGWKASIDDTETTLYRADYAFRSVLVPSGQHTVRFVYQPQSFIVGAVVSIGTTVLLLGSLLGLSLKRKKK